MIRHDESLRSAPFGLKGNDTLTGGTSDDLLFGGDGNDASRRRHGESTSMAAPATIPSMAAARCHHILCGCRQGQDHRTASHQQQRQFILSLQVGVTLDLANAAANTGFAKGDTYTFIERFGGSKFADKLFGSAGATCFSGMAMAGQARWTRRRRPALWRQWQRHSARRRRQVTARWRRQ